MASLAVKSAAGAAAAASARFLGKPNLATTAFMCCDIQERFRDLIWNMESVIANADLMMTAATILERPCIVTEQYPQRLGNTVKELAGYMSADNGADGKFVAHEKKLFSMMTEDVSKAMTGIETVILFGIETHVCILQTSIDLLSKGVNVYIVADGVSSQRQFDRTVALQRLNAIGATVTTSESLLFELIGSADHPKFKQISKAVVGYNKAHTTALSCL